MAMNAPMQPNFARGYPQAAQRSPATPRRGAPGPGPAMPIPPHPQQVAHPQYMAAHQRNMPQANEAALRRSRKPTDKFIPDALDDIVIGNGVQEYKRLRELERRLDSSMVRKRLDIQDSLSRSVKRYRTLRIWISNTVEGQPWKEGSRDNQQNAEQSTEQQKDSNNNNPGFVQYKVRIEGRLLDDNSDPTIPADDTDDEDDDEDAADAMQEDGQGAQKSKKSKHQRPRQRLSHFFKSITVDFDKSPNLHKSENLSPVSWEKPQLPPNAASTPATADFDSITFSRGAQSNLNVTVSLVRDETPERLKLHKDLAEILDTDEESRSGVILGIWDYIRAMGLQEDLEKRQVRCDHRLKKIFGRDTIFFPQIPEITNTHATPLDPIKLPYTIRLDQEFHNNPTPTIYDIRVSVDDPLRQKMLALTSNNSHGASLRQISVLDDQLSLIIQAILHSQGRQSFYTALSKDPANFIRRWHTSQRRDLQTILGEASRGGGEDGRGPEFRRGGQNSAWNAPVAREAVRYMLARPDRAAGYR